MPIQKIKDPQTGEIREEYVLPTAAPAKPTAKPAAPAKPAAGPTYGIEDIGGIIKDLAQGPSALLQATPGSVSAAAQELVKTGDLGKAFQKGQTTYIKDLEKPGRGAARTIYSAGRNIVQETSDLLTADIPAKLNIPGARPTTAQRPDAPLFGVLPPLAKPKSSGVAEDLVTGLVQIAIPWAGVSRGVGFAGAALSKLPGAARVGQAATTTAQAVAASKAGQVAARIPGAVPVGKAIAENVATKAAATGAIIDFAAFDQHTGRLTDLIAQTTKGTPLENIAIDYLKSDPKDVGLDGRLKNSLEGLGFGTGVSVVFRLLGAARAARLYKADPTPVKAQQVQQTSRDLETELAKQQSAAPPIAQPVQPAVATPPPYVQAPALKDIAEVNPQNIVVDPQRFQYKIAGAKTKTGATGSLEGSTGYNPLYAGTISVWEDPADGITYVVNGHNRLRLAKESNYDKVLVRYLPAKTAKEARAMGALQNIAEGQGTAIDAAKFMRDMTADAAALQRQGLSIGGKITSRAVPLARLPQNVFDQVATGALTEDKAIALGSVEGMDPTVINSVAARAEKGKWSADKITQAMQEAKFATASIPAAGGGMLPGFEDFFATSNFDQLLDVRTEAAKALREGVIALSSAARAGRQGVLEAAGNVIDVAGSQAAKASAQQSVNLFDRVTQYEGPVRALLNDLATQVTPKKKAAQVVKENLAQIRAAIDDEANGPRLPFEEPAPEAPRPQPTPVEPELPPTAAPPRPLSSISDAVSGQPISIAGFRGEGKAKADIYAGPQVAVAGEGRYIAVRQMDAKQYGDKITEETIQLERPLVIESDSAWRELTQAAGWRTGNLAGYDDATAKGLTEELKQLVISRGHDGLIVRVPESEMTGKTLQRVFDHDQVIAYNQPQPTASEAAPVSAAEEIVDNVIAARARAKYKSSGNIFLLPSELARSTPAYSYGAKNFKLQFASDIDKTAYILANDSFNKASKAAPKFRDELEKAGYDVAATIEYGRRIRDAIKEIAKDAEPGLINLPSQKDLWPVFGVSLDDLTTRVIERGENQRQAVQPMGNAAAAAIEPPSPLAAEIKAATRKIKDQSKIPNYAISYRAYFNAGKPDAQGITEQQAIDAVRAAGVSFNPDGVPSLNMKKAREDGTIGRFSPELKAVQDAYRSIYDPTFSFPTLRSKGPELPELPKKPKLTREEIETQLAEIDALLTRIEKNQLDMSVDEPATRALAEELTKIIRTVAGDEPAIRFNKAFMETKGGDVAWGYKPGETMKVGGEYDPVKDIIEINNVELLASDMKEPDLLRYLLDQLEGTAFHEAFHRVQFNFLKPEELSAFNQYLGKLKIDRAAAEEIRIAEAAGRELKPIERAAVAFEIYGWARRNKLDPGKALRGATRAQLEEKGIAPAIESAGLAVMDTLYDFLEKVGNVFKGNGFVSIKSIFEDAYSGKLAKRGELGNVLDEANRAVNPDYKRFDLLEGMAMDYPDTRRGELGLPPLRSDAEGPPPPDETYTKRFVDQIIENKNKIETGEITLDDLLVNNVQKFESPSGKTSYVPSPPVNAVQAYRAFSDIFTRPEATGIPVISLETIARETDAWLAKNNYNATAVIEGLQKLSGPLANYEDNLIKLRAGQLYVDDANLKAGIAANKFLNAAADSTADMNQLTADLLTAATYQKAANIALESVTRPIGQLLYSLQGPRPEIGSIEFTQGLPSVKNVGEELEEALDAQAQIPVDESIGKPISPELEEAIVTGEYGPKELEELDQLARSMAQSAVTPGFAKGFWKQVNESAALYTRGLIIYRAAQLLTSGLTLWSNTINNGIRLLQLPVAQALGAGLSPRASQSLMIYGQYVSNLQNAFRLGIESFKAGRGLYDLDDTTMDFLDKMVKEDAQLPLDPNTVEGKGEWNLNTMPWVDIQDKAVWAIAQRKIWQGLNLSTRTQVSLDTFFKVLAGQSFEYVRNLQPGLDRAVGQGMDAGSKEAWGFAQEYAQAAVDRATRDVVINGRTILDAVMTSPQAQTAMRYATFTDDIWAQMETRTPTRAQELAAAQGLEGQAATEYINNYLNTTEEIPFFSRTFSMMPAVWQKLIDFSPLFSIIQPFNRTPGDIVKSVARMTPAAPLVDTFWRDINSADAFTRDRAKGDIAIGMAAISLGTIAMTQGRVEFTGGGPQEPSAKQKWRESGKVPYSFRVRTGEDKNGQPIFSPWVSMRAFEPLSSLFGGMADYQEIANKLPTEARERLGSALTMDLLVAVAGGQLSKSYYQGFAELYEAFTGTGELDQGPNVRSPIERYISRVIISMVPFSAALRAGRRIEDPTVRVVPPSPVEGGLTGIPMRLFEETYNELRNGIAGWSESLPPRINWITGQPLLLSGIMGDEFLPPDQPYLSTLAQFVPWSPLQVAPKVDPVMAEMTRLSGRGANFRGPTNTDFGKEFRLTPRQFADYSMAAANVRDEYGRNIYMALEQLINSPFYQSLPEGEVSTTVPSRRAAAIDREVSTFKALGKMSYLGSRPDLQQELGVIEGRTKQVQYELKYGQSTGLPQ
ncbi:MAG: hypothetical protein EBR60_03235, partial [Burkholderiaceae bacterium]|nr:hypothetical protein [Burkholderiaceae bacterium]